MDQQIDEYQESVRKLWQRIKAGVFKGVPLSNARGLGVSLLLAGWVVIPQVVWNLKFVIWTLEDTESTGMLLYTLFQPIPQLLTLLGIVMVLRVRKLGWVLISAFFMSRILWFVANIASMIIYPTSDMGLEIFDDLQPAVYNSWFFNLFWLAVSVLFLGYYMSKPVRQIFDIKRTEIVLAVVIMLGLKVVASSLGLLL